MVTEDLVDLNLTMSPSSLKIPALRTKNSAQPCQTELWRNYVDSVRPIDDDECDIIFLVIIIFINSTNKLVPGHAGGGHNG